MEFKLSVLVFNCLHNLAPSYLSTMCQPVADNTGRHHLRSAARGDLAVPATRTLRYGPRSFAVAGPSTWNSLPAPIRSCHLISAFRRDLKTELFARAYHQLVIVSSCKSGRTELFDSSSSSSMFFFDQHSFPVSRPSAVILHDSFPPGSDLWPPMD